MCEELREYIHIDEHSLYSSSLSRVKRNYTDPSETSATAQSATQHVVRPRTREDGPDNVNRGLPTAKLIVDEAVVEEASRCGIEVRSSHAVPGQ